MSFNTYSKIPSNFKVLDLVSKKNIDYSHDKKRARALIFLSSTCPCSKGFFNHLNELNKKYSEKVEFLAFHSAKFVPDEKAAKYIEKYEFSFPVFADKSLKFANLTKALKTPHVFIYSSSDELLYEGGVANSRDPKRAKEFYLADALSEIANNKPVTKKQTRALGCFISR